MLVQPAEIPIPANPYSLNTVDPYDAIAALRAAAQLYRMRGTRILQEAEPSDGSADLARIWLDISHIAARAANAAEKACAAKTNVRRIDLDRPES